MVRRPGHAVIALGIFLGACGPSVTQTPVQGAPAPTLLTLPTDDDSAALRAVAAEFRARGWNAAEDARLKQVVLTSPGAKKYGVRASMQSKGVVDRLVLFKAFMLKPEAKGSPRAAELVAQLSNDVSGVAYQLSTDGAVVCVSWVYFVDTLDVRLVTAVLELLDEVAMTVIAKKSPELLQLLR